MAAVESSVKEVPADVVTRMVTPQDKMMEYRSRAWQETLDGINNYRSKFGDTVRGKELAQKKVMKVNQIFSDVIRYELGLKPDDGDAQIPSGEYMDPVEYRRKILEKKRICNAAGEPLHIYKDRNDEFRFVDEYRNNGVGISLEELKHFVTNYSHYCDVYKHAYIPAYLCIFGYKIPINIEDEEIASKDMPNEDDMTNAYVNTLKKTQTLITDFFAKYKEMEPTPK